VIRFSRRAVLTAASALAFARPAAAGNRNFTVALVPLGTVEQSALDLAVAAITERLDVTIKQVDPLPLPDDAFYAPRKRYRAEKLLDYLDEKVATDAWKILSVTGVEISTTKGKIFDWGIAGIGALGGRPCVLSTYLYKKHSKTQEVFNRRLADVTVHEFGHTLGLNHCPTPGCVMSDAKGKAMASADASTGHYCARCRPQVQWGALILKPSPLGAANAGKPAGPAAPGVAKDGGQ
jgi:archaemetzincin